MCIEDLFYTSNSVGLILVSWGYSHPSLPRLLGYSAPDAATPFLVLGDGKLYFSNSISSSTNTTLTVSTIALNVHLKNMIYDSSIAICVQTVLQFVSLSFTK